MRKVEHSRICEMASLKAQKMDGVSGNTFSNFLKAGFCASFGMLLDIRYLVIKTFIAKEKSTFGLRLRKSFRQISICICIASGRLKRDTESSKTIYK